MFVNRLHSIKTTKIKRNVISHYGLSYERSGVSIDKGNELVRRVVKLNPTIGGFSGSLPFGEGYLVASTDGVGTKLKIATAMETYDTIGIDLVAMNVNDIITCGAKPLFFLDYIATSYLDVDIAEVLIKGINQGCQMSDCVLLGGETAEMPGFYKTGDYDLAGFAVGYVSKDKLIDGSNIKNDDYIVGIPSSGLHSNGFSLARKFLSIHRINLYGKCPWSNKETTVGNDLLTPTRIYAKEVMKLLETVNVKGMSHITGGGIPENVPRMFPKNSNLGAHIIQGSWDIPDVFQYIQKRGYINEKEMRRVFNMGIGFVLVIDKEDVYKVRDVFPDARVIGMVVSGFRGVEYI
jgi:phosphoribosylformylglycinamidine cyclo-ligase